MKSKYRILIIDDEVNLVKLISKRLVAFGYQVDICYTGIDAFDTIQKTNPDIVLLDIKIPEKDGITLYKEIKMNEKTKDLPVIFFSANPSKKDFCLNQLKAPAFIQKPYKAEELQSIIQQILSNFSKDIL